MRIFITGGSGFVGGDCIRRLSADHEIRAMARSDAAAEKVRALGAEALRCDLDSVAASHLAGCEAVVHAAAWVEPTRDWKSARRINVEGTKRLLAAAREAGVKRFIHVSTEQAVFDGGHLRDIDETYPYPASSPYPYSQTKREAEELVIDANESGVFETVVLRPRMVWGPGDGTILANLAKMVDSGAFRWIDGGKLRTATCYVGNFSHAVSLALEKGRAGEVYFITDGDNPTMKEFLTQMMAAVGKKIQNKNAPGWLVRLGAWGMETAYALFAPRKKPPVSRMSAALMSRDCTIRIDKARKELGYRPAFSRKEGMEALKDWWETQQSDQ